MWNNFFAPREKPYWGRCPICGEDLNPDDTMFLVNGDIVGCENCVTTKDAEYCMSGNEVWEWQ